MCSISQCIASNERRNIHILIHFIDMKFIIITLLLSLQAHLLFSQCVSAELSLTWEAGYDIFTKDSMVYIPKLNIRYRNMSNTNYYFLKISDDRNGLPRIGCDISIHPSFSNFDEYMHWKTDYLERAKEHGNYAYRNFYVSVGGFFSYNRGWEVYSDAVYYSLFSDEEQESEDCIINCNLRDIYEYMYHGNSLKYEIEIMSFSSTDLTPENILGAVKDQFVFLEPGEIYVDTYDLSGFKLVEGCFTFVINQPTFMDSVLVESIWDDTLSEWKEE